jgi:hypothetical protein
VQLQVAKVYGDGSIMAEGNYYIPISEAIPAPDTPPRPLRAEFVKAAMQSLIVAGYDGLLDERSVAIADDALAAMGGEL